MNERFVCVTYLQLLLFVFSFGIFRVVKMIEMFFIGLMVCT